MLIYTRHDPRFYDRRLHKASGGGDDMRAQEDERQAKVQAAVDAINSKFGIRTTQGDVVSGIRSAFPNWAGGNSLDDNTLLADFERQAPGMMSGGVDASGGGLSGGQRATMQRLLEQLQTARSGGTSPAAASRESMYTDISGAVRDTAMRDLDRQYTDASKRNTFGLARSGLLGGSVDAEAGGELQTLYGEGKLKATQAGQQAGSDLRAQDEKTRQNLISMAQSGMDTGTASSLAASQMDSAAELAKSQTANASVGRLFDNLGQAYLTSRYMNARYPNGVPAPASGGYSSNLYGERGYTGRVQN